MPRAARTAAVQAGARAGNGGCRLMPKLAPVPPVLVADMPHPVPGGGLGPSRHDAPGDRGGLTQFGVHLGTLPPGARWSHRPWQEAEDGFLWMIAGEAVLIAEEEAVLRPGDAAARAPGRPVGHCLENRSQADATCLVVGTRSMADTLRYPDTGLTPTITDRHRRVFRDRTGAVVPTRGDLP